MKAKRCFKTAIFLVLLLVLGFGGVLFQSTNQIVAADDASNPTTSQDENFCLSMTAINRQNNADVEITQQTVSTTLFHCMKWRDLKSLTFQINKLPSSEVEISSFKFLVTYFQSETPTSAFGNGQTETLIESASFSPTTFYYYIDSNSDNKLSPTTSKGHDFGLYKFDFIYNNFSHVEMNIAVIPDNITDPTSPYYVKIPSETTIIYSISSSYKLLNKFNFSISNDAFKFVNPSRLQWEADGIDLENIKYCLDENMQKRNQPNYYGYELIYKAALQNEQTTGTSFHFDSNDIEGIWNVTLKIMDENNQIIFTKTVSELSTVKTGRQSYLWQILVSIICFLLLLALIVLIVYFIKRKHEKVW